ncbi:HNH endonuclease [Symbiopectobacterium purcellii]|uniref:HNH endonuclease n=1 Tax=Symbiopectobacterium purcellii TaxID=2871826 RepID=UPI003F82F68B
MDNNKQNNRIKNLRLASKSQNGANRGLQKNNTSGFKGGYWSDRSQRWVVYIKKNKKPIYIGSFKSKLEAAAAYDDAFIAAFGAFAKTNLS